MRLTPRPRRRTTPRCRLSTICCTIMRWRGICLRSSGAVARSVGSSAASSRAPPTSLWRP
jgi:hypothetical protein